MPDNAVKSDQAPELYALIPVSGWTVIGVCCDYRPLTHDVARPESTGLRMYKGADHAGDKYNKASKSGIYPQCHLQRSLHRPAARLTLRCKPIVILPEMH